MANRYRLSLHPDSY